jgi:DNA-binding IclR family transcriptional regulator
VKRKTKGDLNIEPKLKTVEKAFYLIEHLAEQPRSFNELIHLMNSNKATIHRFLSTLESLGYINKNPFDLYELSYRFFQLASSMTAEASVIQAARPFMKKLLECAGESVLLAGFSTHEVRYLDKVESSQALRIVLQPGELVPFYPVASGKLYLSQLTEEELERYLDMVPLVPFTRHTIVERSRLLEQLEEIRERRYAVDHEEWQEGIKGAAFPIWDGQNRLAAALCIAGVSYRFTDEKIENIRKKAASIAGDISAQLGYEGHVRL